MPQDSRSMSSVSKTKCLFSHSPFNKSNNKTNKDFLLELKELFDDGLITEQEYKDKRKQYIEKI